MSRDQLISIFKQFLDQSNRLLLDYEKICDDSSKNKDLTMIQLAYLESIIINFSKIFSYLKCDNFGVKNLKCISPKECKAEIIAIESEHKGVIGKIINNRNKIIAHTDKNFHKLKFSKNYIKRLEEAFDMPFDNIPTSEKKENERYTIQDMRDDLKELREIIQKLDKVWTKILMFYYSTK